MPSLKEIINLIREEEREGEGRREGGRKGRIGKLVHKEQCTL